MQDTPPIFTYSKITMMPTTTHRFNFKNIPYHIGIRHIHAPEYISDLPLSSRPFFKLKNTTDPVSYGPCTLISCDCEILGRQDNIRMFTDRPNESQIIIFLSEGIPYLHIHFIVTPLDEGHSLSMVCTYYRSPKMIYLQLKPLLEFMEKMQDEYKIIAVKEDPHLNAYRQLIL
jgi:hypothetical protein